MYDPDTSLSRRSDHEPNSFMTLSGGLTIRTDLEHNPRSSKLDIPRYIPPSPVKPIPYPHTSTTRLTSTLRPRRRSAFLPRRVVQLLSLLSVPLLAILLLRELSIHHSRHALVPSYVGLARERNLTEFRQHHLVKRRTAKARDGSKFKRGFSPGESEAELVKEAKDMWPAWWGNPDTVGKSPFDFVPRPGLGKRRIMFLTGYVDYLERMNTQTYEIIDAALRHPDLEVDVWGPGWSGYDPQAALSVNIKRRQNRLAQLERVKSAQEGTKRGSETSSQVAGQQSMEKSEDERLLPWDENEERCGYVRFDLVWTISDIFKQDDPLVDALDCGTLLVQQLGDCHELRCMNEWYPQANNITLSKYAFELQEVFRYDIVKAKFPTWNMGIFGHSPDTANEWDFWPAPWSEKKDQAATFGYDGSFYPIRTTVTNYLETFPENPLVIRHEHPGYFLWPPDSARENPLETYDLNHPLYAKHLALREDFARGMREARICVFDASLERKMIRKYAQALLSGCVIAGDLHTEHEEALEGFTIQLKPTWDIERIHQELEKYLADEDRLHQMAVDGFVYARSHLTAMRKVSEVLDMADAYRRGFRGYEYSHSFSSRCRAYWSGEDAYRPPWCSEEHHRGLEDMTED